MAKYKKAKNSKLNSVITNNGSSNENDGKKYSFVSGVKVPDMKEILAAASDFDSYGVADIEVNQTHDVIVTDNGNLKAVPQGISELQKLGDQVAEDEAKAQEERRRMLNRAISSPQSVESLRQVASSQLTDERRAIVERELKEREEIENAENAKMAARAERRMMQQRAVVDLLIKKENRIDETEEKTSVDEIEEAEVETTIDEVVKDDVEVISEELNSSDDVIEEEVISTVEHETVEVIDSKEDIVEDKVEETIKDEYSDMSIDDFFDSLSEIKVEEVLTQQEESNTKNEESAPEISSDILDSFSDFL